MVRTFVPADLEDSITAREHYLPYELALRGIIELMDAQNPKAIEQLIILMCWLAPGLTKTDVPILMDVVQQLRVSEMLPLPHEKIRFITLWKTGTYSNADLGKIMGMSRPAVQNWIDAFKDRKFTVIRFSGEQYEMMKSFILMWDKINEARVKYR